MKSELVITGSSEKTYIVEIFVQAGKWKLAGPGHNLRYITDDGAIGCSSIKVMGNKPNRYCVVRISVKGGSINDITPTVNTSRYSYYLQLNNVIEVGKIIP